MTQEELALFHELLTKYLAWQASLVKPVERHAGQEITQRDYQAMCNFLEEGISLDAIAEHFGCSVAHIEQEIVLTEHYGYLRRTRAHAETAETAESRSDALKTFQAVLRRFENQRTEVTWQEYLDSIDWQEAYEAYGVNAPEVVKEKAQEIALKSNIELVFSN